jgi:hypothetical protein
VRLGRGPFYRNGGRGRNRRRIDHQLVSLRRAHGGRMSRFGWLVRARLTRVVRRVVRRVSVRARMPFRRRFRRFHAFLMRGFFRGLMRRLMRRMLRLRGMCRRWRGRPSRRRREASCRDHHHHCTHAAPPSMSRDRLVFTGRRLYPTGIDSQGVSRQRHLRRAHRARGLHGDRPVPGRRRLDHRQASFGDERAGVDKHLRADLAQLAHRRVSAIRQR